MQRCAQLTSRRRHIACAVGLVVVAVVLASVLLQPRQTGHVAVLANVATPAQVVTAYLDALNVHDCETAETVMTQEAKASARSWCKKVARLTDVVVGDHFAERPTYSGRSDSDEVVYVPVTFNLNWRLFHNDVSMDEGSTTWGYLLVRRSADSPWRIFDQGVG